MSAHIDKEGNLIITIHKQAYFSPAEELQNRRKAIINLLSERSEDFQEKDTVYHALQLLEDTEPTFEQWKSALQIPPK